MGKVGGDGVGDAVCSDRFGLRVSDIDWELRFPANTMSGDFERVKKVMNQLCCVRDYGANRGGVIGLVLESLAKGFC